MSTTAITNSEKDRLTVLLCNALRKEDHALVQRFIDEGADVNGRNPGEQIYPKPWVYAKSADAMQLLIDAGADVNARTEHTTSNIDGTRQKANDYPLHRAMKDGNLEVARVLLGAGADPNTKNSRGDRPLHISARRQDEIGTRACELLLEHGANPNVKCTKTHRGGTPLHWASRDDTAQVLIRGGADVNARDSHGNTPLHPSRNYPHWNGQVLLDAGADLQARNNEGDTPLHISAGRFFYRLEACKVLLEAGADINAVNDLGQTPVQLGQECGSQEIRALLDQAQMRQEVDMPMEIPDPAAHSCWDDEGDGSAQVQTSVRRF